jgi:hypothetical protein
MMLRLRPMLALLTSLGFFATACGGATNPTPTPTNTDSGAVDAQTEAGVDAGPELGASCRVSPECNANPVVSALFGRCVNNKCICETGFKMNAAGLCDRP